MHVLATLTISLLTEKTPYCPSPWKLLSVLTQCGHSRAYTGWTWPQLKWESPETDLCHCWVTHSVSLTGTKCAPRLCLPESRWQGRGQQLGCEGREHEPQPKVQWKWYLLFMQLFLCWGFGTLSNPKILCVPCIALGLAMARYCQLENPTKLFTDSRHFGRRAQDSHVSDNTGDARLFI